MPVVEIATSRRWSSHFTLRPPKRKAAHKMCGSLTGLFNNWRRNRGHFSGATNQLQHSGVEPTGELERVFRDVNAGQQELQRRWEYLAEAQKLSNSGIFSWQVSSGMLEWSDETYRILGFTRETNPTLDLVFDRIHPEDRERLLEIRDLATRDGIDLDVEHRLLMIGALTST